MKATTIEEKPKAMRGFRVMSKAARTRIAAMGGRKTAKKLGRKYMATIGRRGRLLRAARERKAKAARVIGKRSFDLTTVNAAL